MTVIIRPARQEDQQTIVSLIRQAKINPRNLRWQNFLVAEEDGRTVGIRQVKVHSQGTREVGSGFVLPEYRHQCTLDEGDPGSGIGSTLYDDPGEVDTVL